RDGARRELRRKRRDLRADARFCAEVRRPEQGEPDRTATFGDADAAPPRRADRGEPPRACDRGRDRRRKERHLRPETFPRRSDVIVITAGKPRSPGMSRDDLVTTNEKIVGSVTQQVVEQSPDAVLIVVSNPLDAMCHVTKTVSGFPKERVVGMAGINDTARFSTFISWDTGSSVKDITAMVLGGHGDQMVPVVSATTVGGVPLTKLVPRDR